MNPVAKVRLKGDKVSHKYDEQWRGSSISECL